LLTFALSDCSGFLLLRLLCPSAGKGDQLLLELNKESYIASKPKHFRPFLEALVMTQPFAQFMDQQMDEVLIKAGMDTPDIPVDPSFGRFDRLSARLPEKSVTQSRKLKNGFEKLKIKAGRMRGKGHQEEEGDVWEIAARGIQAQKKEKDATFKSKKEKKSPKVGRKSSTPPPPQ